MRSSRRWRTRLQCCHSIRVCGCATWHGFRTRGGRTAPPTSQRVCAHTGGDVPALQLIEARYAGLAGDRNRGATLLDGLPAAMPERWSELARYRLRMNDPAAAIPLLDQARADAADDVQLRPLTKLAWRATGDPLFEALVQNGHVTAVTIGLNADELATLAERLRDLHRRRWPPLGQSVRSGTQIRGTFA